MRNRPVMEAADVAKVVAAAKAEATKNGWDLAFAVVNEAGLLLHVERMSNMEGMAADVAVGKARTAALSKKPSKDWEDRVKDRPGFHAYPGNMLGIQGGVPLIYENKIVGAIGVSGGKSQDDEAVANAGAAALTA